MNITKEKLVELYTTQHKTMQEIADIIGYCRAGVFKLLKRYNIETRKRGTHDVWNKGKKGYKNPKHSLSMKKLYKEGKIRTWNKGLTIETDERVKKQEKQRRKNRIYIVGISWGKHTEETKSKLSLSHGGNGIPYSNTEYGSEFDNNLKEQVRFRDTYKCQECGCSQLENGKQLDVHHIDYNKKNSQLSNLIALCISCHRATNSNRQYWQEHFSKTVNHSL